MKAPTLWLSALSLAIFALCAPLRASAAVEFCPARVAQVMSVSGAAAKYAIRLTAFSPRSATGQLLLETDRGWYRAPFAPLHLEKTERGVASPLIYVDLGADAQLRNVWLSQAASDDPQWGPHGIVSCAPAPQRRGPSATVQPEHHALSIAAMPIAPPFSFDCATPFADAKVDGDGLNDDYEAGEFAEVRIDLDATGKPIDVTGVDASGGDFMLRKTLEERVQHMRFTPAMAYCRPVPSTNFLREEAAP